MSKTPQVRTSRLVRLAFMLLCSALGCDLEPQPGEGTSTLDSGVQATVDAGSQPPGDDDGDGDQAGDGDGDATMDAAVNLHDAGGGDDDAGIIPARDYVRYVDPFIGTDDSTSPHPVPGGAG